MKRKAGLRIVKSIYLACCLVVAFTPNKITVKDEVHNTTQVDFASEEQRDKYKDAFAKLEKEELSKHEGLTSVIVSFDGEVYYERYFNGSNENSLFEIQSCSKTVIALLTGIAHDNNMIGDEKSKYIEMFNGLELPKISEGFADITLEDMLSMSSGINWDKYTSSWKTRIAVIENGLGYGINMIPSAELLHDPGEHFNYDSNESRSVMAMVAYNSQMEDCEFADKYLFKKLEIDDYLWPYNDSGLLTGGKDFYLSSRDLWKIGQLLLDKGEYKGQRVVSEEWVNKMFTPIRFGVPAEDIEPVDDIDYSFYMWHIVYDGIDINYAYGRGGQCVFLVPEYNICVVTSAIDKDREDSFRNIVFNVIDMYRER